MSKHEHAFETIDLSHLHLITGGQQGAQPQQPPAPAVNEENYSYWGGQAGRVAGEVMGSETAARHLQSAGEAAGRGIYRAGSWLGEQAGRLIYGNN
jgi:hypothetical protein